MHVNHSFVNFYHSSPLHIAVDMVASLMERGEVCKVKTTSRFAYGPSGRFVFV